MRRSRSTVRADPSADPPESRKPLNHLREDRGGQHLNTNVATKNFSGLSEVKKSPEASAYPGTTSTPKPETMELYYRRLVPSTFL